MERRKRCDERRPVDIRRARGTEEQDKPLVDMKRKKKEYWKEEDSERKRNMED